MKNLALLLLALTVSLSMSACSDSDDDNTEEPSYENPADASIWFFKGEMTTTGENNQISHTEKDLAVKLVFDEKKEKCNMVIYKAQFDPAMPMLDIVVNGLDVKGTTTLEISGTDIIPFFLNGQSGQLTPMPSFIMTGIKSNARGDEIWLTMKSGSYPLGYQAKAYEAKSGEFDNLGESFEKEEE